MRRATSRLAVLLPRSLPSRLTLAVGAPLLLAALAGLAIYGALHSALAAQAEIERIERVVERLGSHLQLVIDAQTGQRGFALAGEESFLAPFEQAVGAWPRSVRALGELLAGRPEQLERLARLDALFERWCREAADVVLDGRRAVPPAHVTAAQEARERLPAFAAAHSGFRLRGTPSRAEVSATFAAYRSSVERAHASARDPRLLEAWAEVSRLAERYQAASVEGLAAAADAVTDALAPATARASKLSLARHREAILPITSGAGNRLVEEIRAIQAVMVGAERARLDEAIARVERRRRSATAIAAGSLVAAIGLAFAGALAFARSLVRPIRVVVRAAEALERGDLSARAVAQTSDELGRLANAFNRMAERLDRRDRQISRQHELSQLLQTAADAAEAFAILERFSPALLPGASGTLHTISPSRVELDLRVCFGERPVGVDLLTTPADCWALRQGRTYLVPDVGRKLVCGHLGGRDGLKEPYACLPLVTQGETIGLLHVAFGAAALEEQPLEERLEELEGIAGALALALGNLALREQLRSQSVRDGLTGLYNRRFLEETLPRELERCQRRRQPLTVVMADLDHFKRLNDTWGHEAGDLAIQRFAEAARRHFRQEDLLCRYGGEEFCFVLPECSIEDARRRAGELLEAQRSAILRFGRDSIGPVTASLGLAAFPEHGADATALVRLADAALYRAKRAGRDRMVAHDDSAAA